MLNILKGQVILVKRLRQHAVWNRDPFNYAQAWVDLLLLANDAPRNVTIKGETISLKRGQLAWSQRSLEREWKRSGEWVKCFLNFCQDESMIRLEANKRKTVITILNYDVYNPIVTVTEPASEPVTEPERKGEAGNGKENGEGPAELKNAVSIEAAVQWFANQQSGFDEKEVRAAWHELTAGAVDGNWVTGRPPRPIADWRSALSSELWKHRQIYGGKKTARGVGASQSDGEPPDPLVVPQVTLSDMRAAVE